MATSYLLQNKNILKGVKPLKQRIHEKGEKNVVVQQSDYLKKFMLKIVNDGLKETYDEYGDNVPGPLPPKRRQTNDYDVIIVGAGMAGLSAAYELKKAKLNVKILEQTERYGGRIFTYDENNGGLAPGLYGEGTITNPN